MKRLCSVFLIVCLLGCMLLSGFSVSATDILETALASEELVHNESIVEEEIASDDLVSDDGIVEESGAIEEPEASTETAIESSESAESSETVESSEGAESSDIVESSEEIKPVPAPFFVPVVQRIAQTVLKQTVLRKEAAYTGNGTTYTGLLSDCYEQAAANGGGTITLLMDVTAEAYDLEIYQNGMFTANGTSYGAVPHAMTCFTGGLSRFVISSGMNLTLDLAGHTLNRNMSAGDGTADRAYTFEVRSGGKLTLVNGTITGGYGSTCQDGMSYGSVAVVQKNGTLTLSSVKLTGNEGNGVFAGPGTVTLSGDTVITGNTKKGAACNVLISSESVVQTENLGNGAKIGLTVDAARMSNAVYAPNRDVDQFVSDKGLSLFQNGDYVAVGSTEALDEATYVSPNGTTTSGTFADMWANARTTGSGTIRLEKNVTAASAFTWDKNAGLTVDFNGHVLTATGSSENFFTVSGGTRSSLTLTDTWGSARETVKRVASSGGTKWDGSTRTFIYYRSSVEDQGMDFGFTGPIDQVTADFSKLGGLDVSGFERAVMVTNGQIHVSGGAHRSTRGFCALNGASCKGSMSGGYVFDSGDDVTVHGGAFYFQNMQSFAMSEGVIAGCKVKQGGAVSLQNGAMTITGGLFTGNVGAYNGGAIYAGAAWGTITATLSVSDATFCFNTGGEAGGAIINNLPTLTFQNTTFAHNHAATGGAVHAFGGSVKSVTFTDCYAVNNESERDGGVFTATASLTPTVTVSGGIYSANTAGTEGGAFRIQGGVTKFSGTTVSHNTAGSVGGGIAYQGGTCQVGNGTFVQQNTVAGKDHNLYLASTLLISLSSKITNGKLCVTTKDEATDTYSVPVVNGNGYSVANASDWVESDAGYRTVLESSRVLFGYVDTSENIPFTGVMVQHYAWLQRVVHIDEGVGTKLTLINTAGRVLPNNDVEPSTIPMFVNPDGTIYKQMMLMPLFAHHTVDPGTYTVSSLSFNYEDNYQKTEIWVAKKGISQTSTNPEDWTVTEWTPDLVMTFKEGDVVRLVSTATTGDYTNPVGLYDYDITNGEFYLTNGNAYYGQMGIPASKQDEYDGQILFVQTRENGIHTPGNYKGTGAKLSFGNANTWTTHKDDLWEYAPGKYVLLNQFNRGNTVNGKGTTKTAYGATYGLVTGRNEEGLIYAKNVSAPKLFEFGEAVGKTVDTEKSLKFVRYGDTYTLHAVSGTSLTDLEKLSHPGNYTNLWSNHFWLMDEAPSYGADGHDIKFGSSAKRMERRVSYRTDKDDTYLPVSDDGLDHNAYFGMSYAVKFSLPEHYIGPLEYYFFGDDDIWVFLDDVLVCDIGGVHSTIGEYVNLWDYIEEGDTSSHTLSIYYTERGASGSTCWMKFTMPNVTAVHDMDPGGCAFYKQDPHQNPIAGAEFGLYADAECTELVETKVSDENGLVEFMNVQNGRVYWLKELQAPSGFVPLDSVYVFRQVNGMWKLLDEANRDLEKRVINEPIRYGVLTAAHFGWMWPVGFVVIGFVGCLVVWRRRKHASK